MAAKFRSEGAARLIVNAAIAIACCFSGEAQVRAYLWYCYCYRERAVERRLAVGLLRGLVHSGRAVGQEADSSSVVVR